MNTLCLHKLYVGTADVSLVHYSAQSSSTAVPLRLLLLYWLSNLHEWMQLWGTTQQFISSGILLALVLHCSRLGK